MINFPEILMADLISPVAVLPPLLFVILLAFFFNFVINFIVFSIGIRIFAKDEIEFPPSPLLILFITMSGFLMDFVGAVIGKLAGTMIVSILSVLLSISSKNLTGVSFVIIAVIITILISGLDFLIMKKYLKIDRKKILKLAIWMGVITNPMWLMVRGINRLFK